MTTGIQTKTLVVAALGSLFLAVGCSKNVPTQSTQPKIMETVDVLPGKAISPQDQAKVSSIALKVLGHIADARKELEAKNVDGAKKDVKQAGELLAILRDILPTVKIIDSIHVFRSALWYENTTEVPQDLVTVMTSVDQLYDVMPEGKAKEQLKQAKESLKKEKGKAAPKAKEAVEVAEEGLDFREVDLSVSHVSRWVKAAQADLDKGKAKEAADALNAAGDGVVFIDFALIDPASVAARQIWIATQDYAAKNPKAAKSRLAKAKASLQDVANTGSKTQQDNAKHLISQIDAIDAMKGGEHADAALRELWQNAKKLLNNPAVAKGK